MVSDVDYGYPGSARLDHGSLGLGTVGQGVALRKHTGRLRLAPGVRRWGSVQKHPVVSPVAPRWLRLVPIGYGVSTDGHGAER